MINTDDYLESPSLATTAVLGGGIMGRDVAFVLLRAQCQQVYVFEPNTTLHAQIYNYLEQQAKELGVSWLCTQLKLVSELVELPWSQLQLVIECAPEDLEVKQKLFQEVELYATPDTLLASNSSSFPISRIAKGLNNKKRAIGLHFFMPAHLVPLVEVVLGEHTEHSAATQLATFMQRCGCVPILVKKDLPGFVANRLQHALAREAYQLIQDGIVSPEDVDAAVRFGFGFRYLAAGPIMQKEHGGIDVHAAAAATIYPTLANVVVPPLSLSAKVSEGKLGMKSGEGFYQWPEEKMQVEKQRYQQVLKAGLGIIASELPPIKP